MALHFTIQTLITQLIAMSLLVLSVAKPLHHSDNGSDVEFFYNTFISAKLHNKGILNYPSEAFHDSDRVPSGEQGQGLGTLNRESREALPEYFYLCQSFCFCKETGTASYIDPSTGTKET
eukprot:Nk52_evm1s486 gene=Nk52_evmTU1s486